MIKESCFSKEWLGSFKKQSAHKKIDTAILERMIFAFHLLEKLKASGLNFVFKGGTSLVLLLDHGNRFSIDIDIICREDRDILEQKLNRVIENSRFNSFSLDERRSYQAGVPKAHYSFHYDSVLSDSTAKILLDVLIEDSIYPDHVEKAIQTKWIEVDEEMKIKLPSIDSITGDKLTAFAPDTIGIPYFKGTQSFAMEICKQLYRPEQVIRKNKSNRNCFEKLLCLCGKGD
ncbi:MAG TPA: nucleotidyl transferase AbiEii/AbiGii toxin family protein [Candidatus Rifleibacterium sp.]|nr:nucleotidyl transferase AbiEii/AbiGii toxin family protein [Candidatus Rifleibacterium sp.]HPW58369.1 nucleotidyl transferase AbiEii/AbiGii toxin family protein [Candidatus Rifleibacterium sp.]